MKTNDWLVKGIPEEQLLFEKISTGISGLIHLDQVYSELSDKDYAKKIGITTRKLTRFKSAQYNFTVKEIAWLKLHAGWRFQIGLSEAFAAQLPQANSK